MKERCEKLFRVGKIGYTVFVILIIALSVAAPAVVFFICGRLVINAVFTLVLVDIGSIIACVIYKKSAYYIEIDGEKALLYTDKGCIEKNTSDCKKIISTGFEYFLIFNDCKIRLCRFRKCPEVTACISKETFPNIK